MKKFFAQGVYTEKETPKAVKNHDKLPTFDAENVQTFFDVEIGNAEDEK